MNAVLKNKHLAISLIIFAMLVVALPSQTAAWGDYTYLDVCYKDDLINIGIARRYTNWGFEIGLGARKYNDMLNYPCPHTSYIIVEDKYYNAMLGVDFIRYFDLNYELTAYLGAGGYYLGYDKISRSMATGWYYRESSSSEYEIGFSGGIQIHTKGKSGFGLGYHTLRGFNLQVMLGF